MRFINRMLHRMSRHGINATIWSVIILTTGIISAAPGTGVPKILENNAQYIVLQSVTGEVRQLIAAADDDEDGIDNTLEVNGFTYSLIDGLQPWNGDTTVAYYRTDPLRWSTDGDPYSDYMEVSGVNMPAGVPVPENHPLVAARPVIKIGMTSYDVIPISSITTSKGGEQSNSYTNETSETDEIGGSATASFSFSPFKLAEAEVTASYSHTWTSTQSSTNSLGSNWSTARTSDPSNAAKLKLRVYMENLGSATALAVQPTFNLVLGNKTIATITPGQTANRLAPAGLPNSRYPAGGGTIVIDKDNNNNDIILSLGELQAIQMGAPLGLVVTQVQANVARWNSTTQSFDAQVDWSSFEGEIDPVVINLKAILGNNEYYYYQVYVGTSFYDLGLTFKDVMSMVFNVDKVADETFIADRKYPDQWYVATPSQLIVDEWNRLGRPESLLDFKMRPNTQLVLMSPGDSPKARVDMAIFDWELKHVYVSAFPGNFPIISVKARVKIDGEIQEVELFDKDDALYSNDTPLEIQDVNGLAIVENARGDVTEVKIAKPAVYTSAADVKANSKFLPNPGADYFIALEGDSTKIVKLYCQFYDQNNPGDSLETPHAFLTLPKHGPDANANYIDWWMDGKSGRAYYSKIRISTEDLRYQIWDDRWATGQRVPPVNWQDDVGVAFGRVNLKGNFTGSASANIDLTGTPFSLGLDTEFDLGYGAKYSSIVIDESRQIANITATKAPDYTATSAVFVGLYREGKTSVQLDYKREVDLEQKHFASHVSAVGVQSDGLVNMGEPVYSSNMTIEAWINVGQYPSDPGYLAYYEGFHTILGVERAKMITVGDDGTIQLRLGAWDYWAVFSTGYKANLGEWVHVAYTFTFDIVERFTIKAYINGNHFQTFKVSGISPIGSSDGWPEGRLIVGTDEQDVYGDNSMVEVDELRIWNKVRTVEEIQSTMRDTLGRDIYGTIESGLIGYWRFDQREDLGIPQEEGTIFYPYYVEDGADDVRDYSVSGRHGDLSGAYLVTITSVEGDQAIKVAHDFALEQNYPNPFNPTTTINFSIKQAGQVNLKIFNVTGQEMVTLVNESMVAGTYKVQVNAQSWSSGIYFYQLIAGGQSSVKRMLLIK